MKIVSLGPQHLQTTDPPPAKAPEKPQVAQTASGIAQQGSGSLGDASQKVLSLLDEIRRRRLRKKQFQSNQVTRRYQNLDAFDEHRAQLGHVLNLRA